MMIPVLMYHDIQDDDADLTLALPKDRPYIQKLRQFAGQISYIKELGYSTITVRELAAELQREGRAPAKKKIVMSFDDGDSSNYEYAFQLLLKNNLKATFFITTDFIGKQNRVTVKDLREMHAAGMEIGSHTVTHPVPSQISETQLAYELRESKKVLEDMLGTSITSFSLPTGFYNAHVKKLAEAAGYTSVCTSRTGFVDSRCYDPYDIRRFAVKRTTTPAQFAGIVDCSKTVLYKKRVTETIKGIGKKLLGVDTYNFVREKILRGRK